MTQQSQLDSMMAFRRDDGVCVLMLSTLAADDVASGTIDVELAYCGAWEKNGEPFELNAEIMDELVESVANVRADIPSDYEHLMFDKAASVDQRKASGWMKPPFLRREGEGDEARLRTTWKPTQAARQYIRNDEYRYPSIAFLPRKDGKPAKFLNFALTTQPFLDGVNAIQCSKEPVTTMADKDQTTEPAATEPVTASDDKPKDEPVVAAVGEPGDDAATQMAALVEMVSKATGKDGPAAIEMLKVLVEKMIAADQAAPPVQASAAPASDKEKEELQKLSREQATEIVSLKAQNEALHGRLAVFASRAPSPVDVEAEAKKKEADALAAFTKRVDDAIIACSVHEQERDAALKLYREHGEAVATSVFLSRTYTVVPRGKVDPEPAPAAAAQPKRDADGRVVIELNRLTPENATAFNALVNNRAMQAEDAYVHLLKKQTAA